MSPTPTIGIFTRPIDQGISGSGHHLLEMVRHVLAQNRDRFRFTLIHYERNERPIYREAEELIVPRNPFAASRAVAPLGFDILHYSPLSPYAPIWGVKAHKVATIHGAEPDLIPEHYSWKLRFHGKVTKPWLSRRMDHLITVSQTSRDYFSSRYRIPLDRFSICYNAVNPNYRRLAPGEIRVREKYGTGERFLLHVSNFSERKNPWTIMRAFAEVLGRDCGRDYRLVLAGNRWENEGTKRFAAELGIEGRVVFTGFISEGDAVELFNAADAFLFPSLAEGFGMPNIEAMACGCPVVTSGAFAIPEIVGDAAIVVPDPKDWRGLADAVTRLLTDRELRNRLVERGIARAASFSWRESADTLLAVYEGLLGG